MRSPIDMLIDKACEVDSTVEVTEHPHELTVKTIVNDKYVSGKCGFTLHDEDGIEVFESGFVYSSHDDATQAADDAIMTTLLWKDDNYLAPGK